MHAVSVRFVALVVAAAAAAAAAPGAADSEEEVEIAEKVEDGLDDCRAFGVPTPLRQVDSAERRRSAIRWQARSPSESPCPPRINHVISTCNVSDLLKYSLELQRNALLD